MNQTLPATPAQDKPEKPLSPLTRTLRECAAIFLWSFILTKLLVFDLDVYLLEHLAPHQRWLLDFKLFWLMGVASLTWLVLGRRYFARIITYILGYPFIIAFWKVPRLALRRWPLLLAFAPGIYRAVTSFRQTFITYTVALLSCLTLMLSSDRTLLIPAMLVLFGFLTFHLYRSLRKAYTASVFTGLSELVRKVREKVETGFFEPQRGTSSAVPGPPPHRDGTNSPDLTGLYFVRWCADLIAEKLQLVATRRRYDLYLILSWLYTVVVTSVIYAFEFLALFKLDPGAFDSTPEYRFWSFLGYSLGMLTKSGISKITPLSRVAILLSYSEGACSVLIAVILVFTVLTAAREAFREDVHQFAVEVQATAEAIDRRLTQVYRLTVAELELRVLSNNRELVNALRKARGFPELPAATSDDSKVGATTDNNVDSEQRQ